MEEKVYEMDDDYKQAQADLLEFIKARDMAIEALKTAHPSRIKEGQKLIANANKRIEACEAALKAEYDAHQATEKSREVYEEKIDDLQQSFDAAMEYLATDHPEFHQKMLAHFDNEEPE